MGAEVMRSKSQANNQALVAEYALLVTEYWICKLRVEGREGRGLLFARLNNGDMDGAVGVTGP